ncbi:FecCD family ABC transporter permease [Teredinibacter turnerae]|uniref:FecCD family ABC transporter permease n=1 Tax=Teredinibacter turnerae TaxID=2426 RepID=UPI00036B6FAE|nr:iron ABC transporter permease [Teredinibacter turnerae]
MLFSAQFLQRYWWRLLAVSLLLVVLVAILALTIGAVDIPLSALVHWPQGNLAFQHQLILEQLRLPRILLALGVGALLAISGTVTQGLFRNPLADPSLIGISSGAAAGASIAIVLFSQSAFNLMGISVVTAGAFCGSLLVVGFVYRMSTSAAGTSVSTMLLVGIALTFLAGSITSLLEFFADNDMLRRISLWRMGGLEGANYLSACTVLVIFVIIFTVLYRQQNALNVFLLGESEARHLGIDATRLKKLVVVCVAAGVGLSVALAGTIAFIGLVVPHLVRIMVGPNHRYMIPLTACVGAMLLVLADALARWLIAPTELPVGLVTAFIGAPVFISMLYQRRRLALL